MYTGITAVDKTVVTHFCKGLILTEYCFDISCILARRIIFRT